MLNIAGIANIPVEKINDGAACCPLQSLLGLYIILWTSDICMNDLPSREIVSYWFHIVNLCEAAIFKYLHEDSRLLCTIKYVYSCNVASRWS